MLRVMIVLDCGLALPSAIVRGIGYQDYFNQRQDYHVNYISHRSPFMERAFSAGHRPIIEFAVRTCSSPLTHLNRYITRYQEDKIIERAADYDIVYTLKVASVRLYEKIRRLRRPKLVMDLCDGLWLPPFKQSGWQKFEEQIRLSHSVICENEYLANHARKYNPNIFVVPDPAQVELFDLWRARIKRDPSRIVLGWIGSAATAGSLYSIWEPLEHLFEKYPHLHLRILGGNQEFLPRFEKVNWSMCPLYNQEQMAQEVLAMDIGLYPLFNVEDSQARGSGKAKIYMAGEAVAICQNLGENNTLIQNGIDGILAKDPKEWSDKLEWLVQHPQERAALARAGLKTVRDQFSRKECFEKLLNAYKNICDINVH